MCKNIFFIIIITKMNQTTTINFNILIALKIKFNQCLEGTGTFCPPQHTHGNQVWSLAVKYKYDSFMTFDDP